MRICYVKLLCYVTYVTWENAVILKYCAVMFRVYGFGF